MADAKKDPKAAPTPAPSPAETAGGLEQLMADKKAKIAELRARGVEPFPSRTVRQHDCASVARLAAALTEPSAHSAETVSIAGRLVELRDMGKSIFGRLADLSGRAQVYFKKDALPEQVFALVKKDLHVGDFVSVSGSVFRTKTGEATVAVQSATLLAKAIRPLPEKWHGLADVEIKYRQRHLDLIVSPESREVFVKRAKIVSTIRRVLDSRGYVEVETPVLLEQAGGASARPFHTRHNALGQDMVLRIATELYLKKLVIGGLDRVYEIGRVFRNEGIDTRHNPEFTMLEAYEAYSDYDGMAALFETLLAECAEACGVSEVDWRGVKISLKPPFRRLYLPEVWKDRCGEPIEQVLEGKGFNRPGLMRLAEKLGIHAGEKTPSAKLFDRIVEAKIEDLLQQPTFLFDHPTAITPLAKLKPGTESLVERFECFAAGAELSNAYSELNDPQDQRDRLAEQMRQKDAGDAEADLLDEGFVQAMETGMPPMGGIGVGIDRITMLLTGADSIRDVILFPTLKTEKAG
ncbi:MAG: lysine--tRNA ligase [Elusimicrobiota bacterium]|nr:lysine--tRNA ligase [Elusimicrobiota bacterium]